MTRRGVGLLLMDQTAVAGVGNIFRAEILFKAAERNIERNEYNAYQKKHTKETNHIK